MTTLLDPIATRPSASEATVGNPAARLRATMAACRLQFTWLGTQRSLTPEQRARAAEAFDAEVHYLGATKKLLDTRHPAFRAVTAIRTKATDTWRATSLPFPEPGTRLIPQEKLDAFAATMTDFRVELDDAVANLDRHYADLKHAARVRLGSLYNPADYPETLVGLFAMAWDFPAIEPPAYLMRLSPALYAQEQERVRSRFEEAVQLAEQAFLEEFARLVEHLAERVGGTNADGSPRVFRDSAVENLTGFFARFGELNVRSNAELDALVERAQQVVRGVGAQDLRDSQALRRHVATQLSRVRDSLDDLIVDRPRRRILRSPSPSASQPAPEA